MRGMVLLWAASLVAQDPPLPVDRLPAGLFPTTMPLGLPEALRAPPHNPLTEASFDLGRALFFDSILSADRKVSCASCHLPEHGFASPEPRPAGVHGRRAVRHAPTLLNRGLGTVQFWDGRAASLEEQVLMPIQDPNEMGMALEGVVTRLRDDPTYDAAFRAVYEAPPSAAVLARALSSFVRGLVAGDSAVDRFQAGDRDALDAAEQAGLWLYESKGGCWRCHSGPNLSDESFHNTGIGAVGGVPEPGRWAVTGNEPDRGAFKTPTLRGLVQTAPYMHDGSMATLEEVVAFYRKGGHPNAALDPRMRPLDLTDDDVGHLVAFLRALSRPGGAPGNAVEAR